MQEARKVYRRTTRGSAELVARRSSLGPALNSLLVLIDGQRTREELLAVASRLGAPDNCIDMLEAGEYIQPVKPANDAANDAAGAALEGGRKTAQDAPPDASAGQATAERQKELTDTERYALLYQYLIEAVKKHLGFKGFMYHLNVEKAVTLAELLELIDPVGDAIAKAQGLVEANRFIAKGRQLAGN